MLLTLERCLLLTLTSKTNPSSMQHQLDNGPRRRPKAALHATGVSHGPCVLFFGCRNGRGDFLYKDEWQRFEKGGALTQLVTAFSRDQGAKVYVTHRLREHGADVWRLLQQVFAPSLFAALETPRYGLHPIVVVDPYAESAALHECLTHCLRVPD